MLRKIFAIVLLCVSAAAARSQNIYVNSYFEEGNWSLSSGLLSFGFVSAPGAPQTLPVEMSKSFEIGWNKIVGARYTYSNFSLDIGFGINWRNYKITTPDYRFAVEGGKVYSDVYPEGVEPRNSRLKIFMLEAPVTLKLRMPFRVFGHRPSLSAGVIFDYATHGSMLTRWNDEKGHSVKVKSNKIGHRRFGYDIVGILGLSDDVGIMVRYSPLSVLRGNGQPHFHTFSAGLVLGI